MQRAATRPPLKPPATGGRQGPGSRLLAWPRPPWVLLGSDRVGRAPSTSNGPLGYRTPQWPCQTQRDCRAIQGRSPAPSPTSQIPLGMGGPGQPCQHWDALPTLQMTTLRLGASGGGVGWGEQEPCGCPPPQLSSSLLGSSPQLHAWLPWSRRRRKRSRFLSHIQKYTHTTRPSFLTPFLHRQSSPLCSQGPVRFLPDSLEQRRSKRPRGQEVSQGDPGPAWATS